MRRRSFQAASCGTHQPSLLLRHLLRRRSEQQVRTAMMPPPPPLSARKKIPLPPPPTVRGKKVPPPPLGLGASGGAKLPPPPALPGVGAQSATNAAMAWRSPPEVLAVFVDFVPTFYVPLNCISAIMSDEARNMFRGRNKLLLFFKKYRFYFDVKLVDGVRYDVRLREDVNHPKRGNADEKYEMIDVGENATYTCKAEHIVSLESLEAGSGNVQLKPVVAPPSVHVRLEERVPVLERLKGLMPKDFTIIEEFEEKVPEDVMFHPYFDCQGGISAIATKFPECFQVVDGRVRLRPARIAPLALGEYDFDDSPEPEIMQRIKSEVCASDVPQWQSVTSLYENLTPDEKRRIKFGFRSFASFLRNHGKCLAISQDMLQVARWIPPRKRTMIKRTKPSAVGEAEGTTTSTTSASSTTSTGGSDVLKHHDDVEKKKAADAMAEEEEGEEVFEEEDATVEEGGKGSDVVAYTQTHILNELFDKFPPNRTLNGEELLGLISSAMVASMPKKWPQWLHSNSQYFIIENPEKMERLELLRIRRASDKLPLDVAASLYPYIPENTGISLTDLLEVVPKSMKEHIQQVGMSNIVVSLQEWLSLNDGIVRRLKAESDLENTILSESYKRTSPEDQEHSPDMRKEWDELNSSVPKPVFSGGMAKR